MSEYRRKQAYDAGRKAALGGKPRSSCKRQQGTIFYDDWNDGYDHGQREKERGDD
jgi:hypothetical protein